MILFRCLRGFLVGVFGGLLVSGIALGLLSTLFEEFMTRTAAKELANSLCVPLWLGLIVYFTIRPVLEKKREERAREEQSRSEGLRKHEELQRTREREEAETERRSRAEEKSRSELAMFARSIEAMPIEGLLRLEKLRLRRVDELREKRDEEDREHIAFLADPGNRGCWDAAMDHHRRVYDSIDTELSKIQLELAKLQEVRQLHARR